MNYILFLKLSWAAPFPSTFMITEYSNKDTCEAALTIAKNQYATVNYGSYCISAHDFKEQTEIKNQIKKLKDKIR